VETRAVIFDMDGVLVDSGAHHRQAWRVLLDELGVAPRQPDFWRLTIGRPSVEAVPLLLDRATPLPEARRLAERKQHHYRLLSRAGSPPVRGVVAFVGGLVAQGVPRAVATSASRADAEPMLDRIGLRECFDVVVTAEDVCRGKPDPEVYLRAARGLSQEPARCLVFEDALVGVRAARGAGMRVIGVSTAHTQSELCAAGAERAIDHFEGLTWPA
jgi:HAD superfamily hydrolase (TIGR01509 family)